jgi:hypothetical protein
MCLKSTTKPRILTKAESSTSLPSVEAFFAGAEDVAMLEGVLAAEDGFAEVLANKDKVENVTFALTLLEDGPAADTPARYSALMMVKLSQPGVLRISFKASYQ